MKKRIISIILAFALICSCAALGTFSVSAENETQSFLDRFREDATLVFDDEFDGDKIDETKWEIASGWGRVEETWGTVDDGNYAVEDGHLTLRAYEKVTHEVTNGKSKYKEIQSGEVSSKAAWGDGLIEVRAKLPKGKGVYPAIWTMGRDFDKNTCKWPWSGEIDIMEAVGKGNTDKYNTSTWQTLHTARPNTNNTSAGAAHVATGVGEYGTNGGAALNDDYHTFWVYFDKEIMIIGVDDSMMTIKDLSDPNLQCFREWEQWLVLGLQMGGLASAPERTTYSVWEMLIDYVRVYRFEDTEKYKNYKFVEAESLRNIGNTDTIWALTAPVCVKNTAEKDLTSTVEDFEPGTYDVYAQVMAVADKNKSSFDTYINGVKTGSMDTASGINGYSGKSVYLGKIKVEDDSPFDIKFKHLSGNAGYLYVDKYMFVKTDGEADVVINSDNCKTELDSANVASEAELIAALENLKPDGTVKLNSDITMTQQINLVKDVTIDLNGKTIDTGKFSANRLDSCFKIKSAVNVTFQNGKVVAGGNSNGYFNRFISTEDTSNGVCNFNNIDVTISAKKTLSTHECAFFSYYYAWTDFTVNDCTFTLTGDYDESEPVLISQDGITYNNCTFNCNGGSPFRFTNGNKNKTKKTVFNNCTINDAKYLCYSAAALTGYVSVTLANTTLNNLSALANYDANTSYVKLANCNTLYDSADAETTLATDMSGSYKVVCAHEYNDATCTAPATCKYCGLTNGESKGGHKPGTPTVTREADCYYSEITTVTCTECGEVLSQEETAPEHRHSFTVETIDPQSCTAVPYLRKTCKDCGYVVTTSTNNGMTTYGGTGHVIDESSIVHFDDCKTGQGYYYTCSVCGKENIKKIESIGDHELEVTAFTPATESSNGSITYECKTCDYSKTKTYKYGTKLVTLDGIPYIATAGCYATPYTTPSDFMYYLGSNGKSYAADEVIEVAEDMTLKTVTVSNYNPDTDNPESTTEPTTGSGTEPTTQQPTSATAQPTSSQTASSTAQTTTGTTVVGDNLLVGGSWAVGQYGYNDGAVDTTSATAKKRAYYTKIIDVEPGATYKFTLDPISSLKYKISVRAYDSNGTFLGNLTAAHGNIGRADKFYTPSLDVVIPDGTAKLGFGIYYVYDNTETYSGDTIISNIDNGSVTVSLAKLSVEIPTEHTHTPDESKTIVVPPTCVDDGYTQYVCSECGETYKDNIVAATGVHTYVEKVDSKYLKSKATCNSKAVYYKSCSVCGHIGDETFENGEFDADNHTGETEIRNSKAATCTEEGYSGDTYCKDCGTKIATGSVIEKAAHTPSSTWTTDGENHWHECTACGEKLDKAAHSGGTATCSKKAVCDKCGEEYGELDANNHGETEVRDAKAATCKEEGYSGDTYCKDCGTKIATGSVIEKAAHTPSSTWTTDGENHWHECTACGEKLDKAAHSGGTATCSKKAVCDKCGEEYGELDANNHGETEVKNTKAATCKEEGYSGDTYCKDCGTRIATGNVIAKTSHKLDEIAAKAATHATSGNIAYFKCSICGDCFLDADGKTTVKEADTILPQLEHEFGEYKHDEAKHWHECECGVIADEGEHTFGDWVIMIEPTEIATGIKERVCTVCGYKETEELTIVPPTFIYGDLNGDNKVNLLDLIALRKHLAKWSVDIKLTAADCNADGKVNLMDLILMRKYLAKWDVNLGPQE